MLGKLLKYELKAGLRMLPAVYLVVAASFLIGLLAKVLDIMQIRITMSILIAVAGIAAVIMTLVFVVLRFYKGLFGAEGYLTQTLPVSKGSLILSKVLAAYLWMVLSIIIALLAVLALLYLNDIDGLKDILDTIFGGTMTPLVVFIAITGAAQLLAYLGEIYFAITLSNTRPFIKNNILFSVVFFFISNIIVGITEVLAMLFIPLGMYISDNSITWSTETMIGSLGLNFNLLNAEPIVSNVSVGIGSGFSDLIMGIAFLLVSRWLLTHKTSVK